MPSVRMAVAVVLGVNALMGALTYRQHQRMLDYCAGFSREDLDCLGANGSYPWQLWKAIGPELAVWGLLEVGVVVVLVAALLKRPHPRRSLNVP